MRIGLIYSTNREKATVAVVQWIEEFMKLKGLNIDIQRPDEVHELNYDAYIIGTSVYAGAVREDILSFVEKNADRLAEKPVATFVVCKETKQPEDNMNQVTHKLKNKPVSWLPIEGYVFRKAGFDKQKPMVEKWLEEIIPKLSS